ncbi:unnamed protein product [Penicillium salamii]|nr:unnamed protein product [Penicillium salamii]CAG8245670.1 unnamed protein product [Penicillium salamii]
MDPISAVGFASAIVQILGALTSTVHGLYEIQGRFSDADFTIHSLIQELDCIKAALTSLERWYKLNSSDPMVSGEFREQLVTATQGCEISMEILSEDVRSLVEGCRNDGTVGLRLRIRVVWKEDIMKGHQEKLHAQVMALQLLLQVCQCHTSQEQVLLLRKATTRRIMERVRDDTETLLSTRSQATSSAASFSQKSSFTVSDRVFDFTDVLTDLPASRDSLKPRAPSIVTIGSHTHTSSGRSPFTDEGYASTHTRYGDSTGMFDDPAFPQQHLLLPTSPSAPVHPAHKRATSYQEAPRPTFQNIPRSKSDTKALKTPEVPASKLGRISSLFRLNTTSRLNLSSSFSKTSAKPGNDTSFVKLKPKREPNSQTSIDLTGTDAGSIPQIVKAAQVGSTNEVNQLIEYGLDIEERHRASSRNALLVAAHCGNDEVVELLIHHHARIDAKDGSGWTALHLAASRGHCGVINLLMREGNIAEIRNLQGRTALRIAVDRSQQEALKMLLMHNSRVDTRAENQMTALHIAAKQGDAEIVNMLASNRADIEAKDATMMTALHYACEAGHVEVIAVLLAHKANIEAVGRDRKTPLICAAEAGRSRAVEYLLKSKPKASSSTVDDTGMTALHWAAYNGHEETVEVLSRKRGSLSRVNGVGRTALHLSVIQTQFAVVEPLLRKGADVNTQCATGLTPLHYACMADSFELASLLLLAGADIEASEYQHQQRALHIAAGRSSLRLLDLLVSKNASLDARDSAGDRPLGIACRNGHVAAVRKLLDLGSPLYQKNQATSRNDSPLCLAAMAGHLPVVSLLLDEGPIASKKDERGWQPFRYAAYHGHTDVLQLLLEYTKISDVDVPDIINMTETIGFSPDAVVTEQSKVRIRELLNQAVVVSGQMPPIQGASILQTIGQHSNNAQSVHSRSTRDREGFLPQELPATLEQGLPSSRSTTPEYGYRAERPQSNNPSARIDIQTSEQRPSSIVSAQSGLVPDTYRGPSPIRQSARNPTGRVPTPSAARGEPLVSANYIPQAIPVSFPQTPISLPRTSPLSSMAADPSTGHISVPPNTHTQERYGSLAIFPGYQSEASISTPADPPGNLQHC